MELECGWSRILIPVGWRVLVKNGPMAGMQGILERCGRR